MSDLAPEPTPAEAPVRTGGLGGFVRRYWLEVTLWKRILLGLVLGTALGLVIGEQAMGIKWVGDLFVRLIRMIVTPLVFFSIVSGIAGMGDVKRLGSIGAKTLVMYLALTAVAVSVGLSLGTLFQPGAGMDFVGTSPQVLGAAPTLGEYLMSIVPLNPFAALNEGNIPAIIFFAILIGLGILIIGEPAAPAARLFQIGSDIMLVLVRVIMELAPFGVFALVAWVMGTSGPSTFVHVFLLAVALVLGCAIQTLIVHGGVIRLIAGLPVVPFFRDIADAVIVAFSTSSSAAVLPVAMRVAEKNLGVSHTVASTTLPLGTTLSMDGTALYVALLAMFSAQAFGVDMTAAQYLMVGLVCVVVAVGTAPVPSASLFMLAAVLQVIGLTAEQTALVVGFILPFDRILDMTRTVPNATSDLVVAVTVAKWEGELDEVAYRAKPVE
jgi:Na+/H+-dicarboxylate symporter